MAGFVPNAWAARLLEATAGRTAIGDSEAYLGLATGLPSDPFAATLENITEVTTAGYARVLIPPFNPATPVPPIQVVSPTAFAFPLFTADMDVTAGWAFLTDAETGTAGTLRYVFQLEIPILARTGEPLNVPANSLILE